MAEFKFFCPLCGRHIQCDTNYCGTDINCPACQKPITVPALGQIGTPPAVEPSSNAKRKTLLFIVIAVMLVAIVAGIGLFLFSELRGKPAGLVAWWRADGNARDSAGRNNGMLQGGVDFAPGIYGRAFHFDTPNAAVKIAASPSLNVGTDGGFTIECWVEPSSLSHLNPIVEWNTGKGSWGVHFYIGVGAPDNLYANIVDSGHQWHTLQTRGGIVTTNGFQHVALTYNEANGIAKLYHNGALVLEQRVGKFKPQTTDDLYLGRRPPTGGETYTFAGLMDEVSIYSRALTSSEIAAIYKAGKAREKN
jgi:hypothetical protein